MTLQKIAAFLAFALAYYSPIILDLSGQTTSDSRVQALLGEALATPVVQWELVRNALGHLVLLVICYVFLTLLAHRFTLATHLSAPIARLLFLVVGWMLLVAGTAVLFPTSDYIYVYTALAHPHVALVLALLLGTGTAFGLWRTRKTLPLAAPLISAFVAAGIVGWSSSFGANEKLPANARNIIIIGIDSLSATAFEANRQYLPNLAELLAQGTSFENAYTPIGRTFPAWMSILSGMSPAEHGAVFNLRNIEHVKRNDLLTHEPLAKGALRGGFFAAGGKGGEGGRPFLA
ncbi:alkaline phosphatase family protein [Aromatoleum bremense]|uniref:Sulfatase-like hydrolase/transferase n=1 Tax=Aromatoleum bremense TaxID=76115 RepID=A0ABX1P0M1_9RHOO|nr:alkaline phosphatase family protein [Aromatoleum bremense]NMG17839.1 sulfatase-like hydrolase/transferase [Aromatoleum bremense]